MDQKEYALETLKRFAIESPEILKWAYKFKSRFPAEVEFQAETDVQAEYVLGTLMRLNAESSEALEWAYGQMGDWFTVGVVK